MTNITLNGTRYRVTRRYTGVYAEFLSPIGWEEVKNINTLIKLQKKLNDLERKQVPEPKGLFE
jgi:hypothetical protein